MSRIHGLHDLTDASNNFDNPVQTMADDDQLAFSSSSAGATVGSSAPLAQVLYLTEAGTTGAISVSDINQGQIGDCFLLSPIGEMALLKPSAISNMIHANANGTETVTLYEASNGRPVGWGTTSFKAVTETVSNVFPTYSVNNAATQDVAGGQKEIWAQVLEKADATLNGGYAAIAGGGSPVLAMEQLTGHTASFMSPATLTWATLQSFVAAGDMIVMDTLSSGKLSNNLVNNHAYMFEGVTGSGSSAMVHLGNPWGFNQPTAVPLSQLSHVFSEIDIGHVA